MPSRTSRMPKPMVSFAMLYRLLGVCYQHSRICGREIASHPFHRSAGGSDATQKNIRHNCRIFSCRKSLLLSRSIVRVRVHHMVPGCLVAATKAFAVIRLKTWRDMRMTVLIAIVNVGTTMVVVVFA